ncbi:MAG: phosphopantetheine-binding protein, partial [Gammaproteobacteria bacterium]
MQTTPTGGGPREGHRPRDHAAIDDRIRHYTRDIIGGGAELIPVLLADVEISGDDASGYRLVRDDEIVADGVPRNVVGQLSTRGNAPAAAPAGISPEFGRLWELGLIFFADRHTQIDSRARITARHSILLKAKVKADVHIRGDFAIFDDVVIHERTVIEGPGVLRQTVVDPHSFLSRIYFIENSFIGQFVKCQAGVCADGAIVAAHAAIDGGTHPELYPLTSDGSVPALVDLGTGTWIGHHASLTAGARIGAGSVVAAFTHVDGSVGANRMVAGSPARAIPLDFRIRALTPEQARAAGARHGNTACEFPMYGNPNIGWSGMRALEIDFPEHGHPAGECSDALLEFQRGAFETTFRFLLPGYRCSVTYRSGDTVRFRLDLDRPVGPSSTLRAETMVTAGTRPPTAEPDELEQRLLALIPPGGLSAGELVAKLNEVARIEGLDLPDQLQESICRLSQKGALSPSLIPSLFSPFPTCRLLERVIRRPDEFPELPPFRARTESAAPESGDADARTDEDARKRIRRVIAEMLDTSDAGVPDDLMLAGLSSLHYVELLLRVENEFDMELSSAALEDLPITVSGIANLVHRGHGGDRRRIPRQRPGQHAAAARPLPDIDLAEWAAGDIAAVIGRHIQSPPTPWIFKFLRSD